MIRFSPIAIILGFTSSSNITRQHMCDVWILWPDLTCYRQSSERKQECIRESTTVIHTVVMFQPNDITAVVSSISEVQGVGHE